MTRPVRTLCLSCQCHDPRSPIIRSRRGDCGADKCAHAESRQPDTRQSTMRHPHTSTRHPAPPPAPPESKSSREIHTEYVCTVRLRFRFAHANPNLMLCAHVNALGTPGARVQPNVLPRPPTSTHTHLAPPAIQQNCGHQFDSFPPPPPTCAAATLYRGTWKHQEHGSHPLPFVHVRVASSRKGL